MNSEITAITNNQLNSIGYDKISGFPSTNSNVILGDGSIGRITSNLIDNGSISMNKLVSSTNTGYVLYGDLTFK